MQNDASIVFTVIEIPQIEKENLVGHHKIGGGPEFLFDFPTDRRHIHIETGLCAAI